MESEGISVHVSLKLFVTGKEIRQSQKELIAPGCPLHRQKNQAHEKQEQGIDQYWIFRDSSAFAGRST